MPSLDAEVSCWCAQCCDPLPLLWVLRDGQLCQPWAAVAVGAIDLGMQLRSFKHGHRARDHSSNAASQLWLAAMGALQVVAVVNSS